MEEKKAPPPAAPKAQAPPPASKPLPPPPNIPGMKFTENKGHTRGWVIERGPMNSKGQLVCLYGAGGIGKSTLASLAPRPLFFDLQKGTKRMDVARVSGLDTWSDLIGALNEESLWEGSDNTVVDTLTDAELLAVAHTIATVPKNDQGARAKSVEDYGYGKGYQHVYETFMGLLPALDKHINAGRNVILIAHDCTANVPNPGGSDWIRYEPMLQSPNSGKASIRLLIRNTVDELLFIGYDVNVSKDGKGQGHGSRTIYPNEQAHFMAKSRVLDEPLPFDKGDATLWTKLFGGTK